MKRALYRELVDWKRKPRRKPLILYGARQVGKTYLLKEFGQREFHNYVYFNCDKNLSLQNLFERDYDVDRILEGLKVLTQEEIKPDETLIIFDEVQEIPSIVASLKYFYEQKPQYSIAVAGSLLGVMDLNGYSYPVGKVDILHLYPMTFIEYLWAIDEEKKASLIEKPGNESLVNALLPNFIEYLRQYFFIGGMPEAIDEFIKTRDTDKVREIQKTILNGYYADLSKHAGNDAQKCRLVLDNIPSQLAKENKKFIYGAIKKGARAKEFENAIQWLVDAGMIYRIYRISKPEIPLKFYVDLEAFKLFILDVGLLGALLDTPPTAIMIGESIFSEYKGAFTENYVLSQLITQKDIVIGYFSKINSSLEIDFVLQYEGKIFPIEVKAEENVKSKSLRQFVMVDNLGKEMKGYRLSMKGFIDQDWMSNIPLPAVTLLPLRKAP